MTMPSGSLPNSEMTHITVPSPPATMTRIGLEVLVYYFFLFGGNGAFPGDGCLLRVEWKFRGNILFNNVR